MKKYTLERPLGPLHLKPPSLLPPPGIEPSLGGLHVSLEFHFLGNLEVGRSGYEFVLSARVSLPR